jgi:hypothetical protein
MVGFHHEVVMRLDVGTSQAAEVRHAYEYRTTFGYGDFVTHYFDF